MSELTGISQRPAWISILLILINVFLGFVIIGPLIGFVVAIPFYDGSIFDMPEKLANPMAYPELRTPLLVMQACATFFGLIAIPFLYLYGIEKVNPVNWVKGKIVPPIMLLVTAVIVIAFMAPDSIFIEWNANVSFPDFLKEFGEWAKESESKAEALTKFFTQFTSTADFLFGIFIIAVLPGIGEELVFRGMLQPEIHRFTGNKHIAIWTTAIIFSAFHMQFFGFVPRMLLGALFGYLYIWSGNIIYPMVAHFVNNGFSVVMMYLYQKQIITTDLENPEAAPWPLVILFTAVFVALLIYFKKYFQEKNATSL